MCILFILEKVHYSFVMKVYFALPMVEVFCIYTKEKYANELKSLICTRY